MLVDLFYGDQPHFPPLQPTFSCSWGPTLFLGLEQSALWRSLQSALTVVKHTVVMYLGSPSQLSGMPHHITSYKCFIWNFSFLWAKKTNRLWMIVFQLSGLQFLYPFIRQGINLPCVKIHNICNAHLQAHLFRLERKLFPGSTTTQNKVIMDFHQGLTVSPWRKQQEESELTGAYSYLVIRLQTTPIPFTNNC